MMDARLNLKADLSVIGSVADFTYKWCLNARLTEADAARLSLAVDELVTDIVQFAYPDEPGSFDIDFHRNRDHVVVSITEMGEPFDPDRHAYDRERAITQGDFEGAGLELVRHLADEYVFTNRGHKGKAFRLVKNIVTETRQDILPEKPLQEEPTEVAGGYRLSPLTLDDVEDVSKLIYRTYRYSYLKEELYFPQKIELALVRKEKFGVIVRTPPGEAVGYFAVLNSTDSKIGEVGEAVVSERHRRRGLMKRMLEELIRIAKQSGLYGLFGQAITVHTFSQRVNQRFGFRTTALLVGESPAATYKGIDENYPQPVSDVIDFALLRPVKYREVYAPPRYSRLLADIYRSLDIHMVDLPAKTFEFCDESLLELRVEETDKHALLIIERFGVDFEEALQRSMQTLRNKSLNTLYIDLPLDMPGTRPISSRLLELGFIFCGLMPLMHHDRDYLRLQLVNCLIDMDLVYVYSDMARRIKALIMEEMNALRENKASPA